MMRSQRITAWVVVATVVVCFLTALAAAPGQPLSSPKQAGAEREMLNRLDAPLLFIKRHSYTGIHIYDTYYKWPPGGGGIYVLENPQAPRSAWKIRPVIDPTTPGTLGLGVYTHPELSWDATEHLRDRHRRQGTAAPDRSNVLLRLLQREPRRPARHRTGLLAGRADRASLHAAQRTRALRQ
jgi:hypothetical protein